MIRISRLLLAMAATGALAHEPITTKLTWNEEISRIFYKRCTSCHHPGRTASMSFVTYEDTRPWAKAIKEEVLERRMPPWGAVRGIRELRDDPSLSQPEVDMIVSWVEGGAPKGDDIYLPPPLRFDAPPTYKPAAKLRELVIGNSLLLQDRVRVAALRPKDLPTGGSMEVTAYRPDAGVEHLIWIRGYRQEWNRTYYFRNAMDLPKGTKIAVHSAPGAKAVLLLQGTPREPRLRTSRARSF